MLDDNRQQEYNEITIKAHRKEGARFVVDGI
jgi:hypothetical protein